LHQNAGSLHGVCFFGLALLGTPRDPGRLRRGLRRLSLRVARTHNRAQTQ
jgi:hypothetical protein